MDGYHHILYATSLGPDSPLACARAAALHGCGGGRLTLMHVVENFPQDPSVEIIPPEDVDPRQYREEQARDRLAKMARTAGCEDAELQVCFSHGPAWREILRVAREQGVDLLVLGAPTHAPPATLAETTRDAMAAQAPCDVLTVNGPGGRH